MKNVFVTGFTGLVGSGLLHHFLKNNYDLTTFVALCRNASDTSILEKHCTVERGSSFDEYRLNELFQKYKFDTILHISNKDQILQFAKLAVKYKVKRYLAISSTYVCSKDNPNNNTAKQERDARKILKDNNIDYIFLRPTSIFGTRPDGKQDRNVSIFSNIVRKAPLFPIFENGKATTRPVWGRDVGQALFLLIINFEALKNKEYIVSGDKERTFKQFISTLFILNGKKPRFLRLPKWFGIFGFYCLYWLSLKRIDKRESIHRLLENKSFETSLELLNYGYKATSFEEAYSLNYVLIE